MHSPSSEHVHSLRKGRLRWAMWGLFAMLWVLGCGDSEPPHALMLGPNDSLFTASSAEREAALTVLDSLQQSVMQTAFDRLPRYAFTHRVHTAQRTPDGTVIASRTTMLRFPPPDSAQRPFLVRADSSGSFDDSWLDLFAPESDGSERLVDRVQHVLPSDPAYLAPRTREAFRYRLRPDTSLGRRLVRVVEIRAQPGELGADRAIRHARLFVEPDTHELVGVYLVRAEASVLFREDSRARVQLRPAPDSGWVPAITHFDARLKMPLSAAQSFRLQSSFFAYRPLP